MSSLRELLARISGAMSRRGTDPELDEEFRAHLEMETAEYVRRGMSPEEARRKALIASGGVTQAAEAVRDQHGLPWVESLSADLRYAFRALRRSPAFTTVVVLTLALGIGANTAIFSVVRGVLLKPLPHRDGERLVYLRQSTDGPAGADIAFSVPEIRDIRTGVTSFSGVAEFSPWSVNLQERDGAIRMDAGLVSGNFFKVMGLSPILGRVTEPRDDGAGVPPVMVLTREFWLKHFDGDPGIVGRTVRIDDVPVEVIGVMQQAPFFPNRVDVLLNMVISPHHVSATMVEGRTHRMTEMLARIAPGATLERARAEVAATYGRMQQDHVDAYDPGSHYRMAVLPFKQALGEHAQLTLMLLMGAALFVLVISAANVVNLTLMRGLRRGHELVLRAALGAGVLRLRRLLLVENLLLTLAGSALGVVVALGGMGMLRALAARYSPRASDVRLDLVVLGFALGLAVAIALLLSFVASLPKEGRFAALIAAGAQRVAGGLRSQRLQRGLVVAQVAVSVMLLAGAGLLTRTMIRLSNAETGLRTEQVLTIPLALINPAQLSAGGPEIMALDANAKQRYEQIRRELRALPGVIEVGVGSTMPLRASDIRLDVKAENRAIQAGQATPQADYRTAGPEYFRAAGIPIVRGREFQATDRAGMGRVVIINQTMADKLFPGEDPIGKRIAWTGDVLRFTPFSGDWRTVVGVAGNTQDGGPEAEPRAVAFMPFDQELALPSGLVVRAESNVDGLTGSATRIVRRLAPGVPLEQVLTISQIRSESVAPKRLNAVLVSLFGLLAVLIAAVGIGGVLAFSVGARTGEIGIRMSLGADSGRVQRMILREGGTLVGLGVLLGVGGAWFATQLISGLLFGVAPHDPVTFGGVALIMAAIGIGACWIPALRAARIDPAITMRSA